MVSDWVKNLTEEVIGGSPLEKGKRYQHPEHGVITITGGAYWGRHGLSNHWRWTDADGGEHHGYGGQNDDGTWSDWPEVTETDQGDEG